MNRADFGQSRVFWNRKDGMFLEGSISNRDGIGAVTTVIPDEALYDPHNPVPGTFVIYEQDGRSNYLTHRQQGETATNKKRRLT